MDKPPIGIIPKRLWDELRMANLEAAIYRYFDAGLKVPSEWIDEYDCLRNYYGGIDRASIS
jgi:hypothetical protein